MAIEIGQFSGEWDELLELLDMAFSSPWTDAQYESERKIWERERSTVAIDDGQLVGHTGTFSHRMAVPGGQLPVAGVTMVGVRATHRRRGILRDLMRAQLTDVHDAGTEPLAALTASEPVIYPRFGYGLAADHQEIAVPKVSRTLRPVAGIDDVTIRYVDARESLARCAELRNKLALERPGMFQHDERWQEYTISDNLTGNPANASKVRCVLAERDGELTGFAHYRTKRAEKGYVDVHRVHAVDIASHAALWRYLLEPDLLSETRCEMLASDDPLLDLLLDPRAPSPITRDGLWVRPVDVGTALAGRTYARDVDVVMEVVDDFLPWNAGRWHLDGGPEGASCGSTSRDADLTLHVRDLGAV
jgi:predicted acetyltransferase